jgi:hypothetical protein
MTTTTNRFPSHRSNNASSNHNHNIGNNNNNNAPTMVAALINNNKRLLYGILAPLFIVFIVLHEMRLEAGTGNTRRSIQGTTAAILEGVDHHPDPIVAAAADDDDRGAVLTMTEEAQEENFLQMMSDDDNVDDENSSDPSSICAQEPCNVSIVFMGDSLTRFQYLSLVYFLRHGQWIDPASIPHLVRPMDYIGGYELHFDWSPWFTATMNILAPYENCDCYRTAGSLNGRNGQLPYVCENRYYHDPIRNNTVTYLLAFGSATSIRGHWEANQAIPQLVAYHRTKNESAMGDTVGPMRSRVPWRWEGDWIDAMRGHIVDLAPAVLIVNAGKWTHSFHDADYRSSIVSAWQTVRHIIPRMIWKTTTADRGGRYTSAYNDTDFAMCQLLECLDTMWTIDVPKHLYVDQGHFVEPVYRLLNEQLLYQLGIAIPTSVSSVTNVSSVSWYPERYAIPGLAREQRPLLEEEGR